jgi:hypothetical protein
MTGSMSSSRRLIPPPHLMSCHHPTASPQHPTTCRYKRMSKAEKEALWAQDRAMQQLLASPTAALLGNQAAVLAAQAAAAASGLYSPQTQVRVPEGRQPAGRSRRQSPASALHNNRIRHRHRHGRPGSSSCLAPLLPTEPEPEPGTGCVAASAQCTSSPPPLPGRAAASHPAPAEPAGCPGHDPPGTVPRHVQQRTAPPGHAR